MRKFLALLLCMAAPAFGQMKAPSAGVADTDFVTSTNLAEARNISSTNVQARLVGATNDLSDACIDFFARDLAFDDDLDGINTTNLSQANQITSLVLQRDLHIDRLVNLEINAIWSAMRNAQNAQSAALFIEGGFGQVFSDSTGIDLGASSNITYNALGHYVHQPASWTADEGIYLWYHLDDNLATTAMLDSSGNGNHGVLTANSDTHHTSVDCIVGDCWDIGQSGYGEAAEIGVNLIGILPLTVSGWWRYEIAWGGHFLFSDDDGSQGIAGRTTGGNGSWDTFYNDGVMNTPIYDSADTQIWTHVAMTWTTTTVILYTNGVFADSEAYTPGTQNPDGDFKMFAKETGGQEWRGRVDEWIFITNIAWDATTVKRIYDNNLSGVTNLYGPGGRTDSYLQTSNWVENAYYSNVHATVWARSDSAIVANSNLIMYVSNSAGVTNIQIDLVASPNFDASSNVLAYTGSTNFAVFGSNHTIGVTTTGDVVEVHGVGIYVYN